LGADLVFGVDLVLESREMDGSACFFFLAFCFSGAVGGAFAAAPSPLKPGALPCGAPFARFSFLLFLFDQLAI
jgi:hypothetical protein